MPETVLNRQGDGLTKIAGSSFETRSRDPCVLNFQCSLRTKEPALRSALSRAERESARLRRRQYRETHLHPAPSYVLTYEYLHRSPRLIQASAYAKMSQSTIKKTQASLDSFFQPSQPASGSGTGNPSSQQARTTFKAPPPNFPHPTFGGFRGNSTEATSVNSTTARSTTAASQQSHTSSLSPPPTSPTDPYEIPVSPPKPAVSSSAPGRVVKSSDDEDEDSDSSLEDLATLLQSNHSKPSPNGFTPSTPSASRTKNVAFHTSPMPILNKHKFDLKSLASHAEIDRKTEASSKRVKAMQEATEKKENVASGGGTASEKLKHSSLLQAVVAEKEDADVHKVARAVMRTEATLSEQRWYFFDTKSNPSKPQRNPFPTKSISSEWKSDLKDAQMRNQTFVSGFAEDSISFGKALPDEIFLWILDETCVESSEVLRTSYCNVVKQSSEQVHRLVVPTIIRNMFESVGATSASIATTDKIRPVQAVSEPYAKRDWSKLRSLVGLLGQIAKSLQAKTYAVTLLLRMCVDRLVMENVDIFDLVQEAIHRLCRYIPAESWESNVSASVLTCTSMTDILKVSDDLRYTVQICGPADFTSSDGWMHTIHIFTNP